jgi:hypothetical protein
MRRDFISYNTPERCAMERMWSQVFWRRPRAPMKDWLPEHYKRIPLPQTVEIPCEQIERTMAEFNRNLDEVLAS